MLENVILVILRRKIGYDVYALIFYFKYSSMKRIVTENMDFQKFFLGGSFDPPDPPTPSVQA